MAKLKRVMNCGCIIAVDYDLTLAIMYCPKHKSAPDLYEAIDSVTEKLGKRIAKDGSDNFRPLDEDDEKFLGEIYTELCVALAKTEGKP